MLRDKILRKLGLISRAEYDTLRKSADNDARLAAQLFEECQRLMKENEELSEENDRLHRHVEGEDKLRNEIADLNNQLIVRNREVVALREKLRDIGIKVSVALR